MENSEQILYNISNLIRENRQNGGKRETGFQKNWKFVLVVGLQTVNNEHFQQENLTLAGVFLLSFPVIIFFMFTQKFFVQGIATSGIKS